MLLKDYCLSLSRCLHKAILVTNSLPFTFLMFHFWFNPPQVLWNQTDSILTTFRENLLLKECDLIHILFRVMIYWNSHFKKSTILFSSLCCFLFILNGHNTARCSTVVGLSLQYTAYIISARLYGSVFRNYQFWRGWYYKQCNCT